MTGANSGDGPPKPELHLVDWDIPHCPELDLGTPTTADMTWLLRQCAVQALQPRLPPMAFRLLTSGVRTGNNILGGMSFVVLAKVLGVQQSKGDEILEAEIAEAAP